MTQSPVEHIEQAAQLGLKRSVLHGKASLVVTQEYGELGDPDFLLVRITPNIDGMKALWLEIPGSYVEACRRGTIEYSSITSQVFQSVNQHAGFPNRENCAPNKNTQASTTKLWYNSLSTTVKEAIMAAMIRFYLFMPTQMLSQLREYSEKRGLPVSEVARNAITEYMAANPDK